MKTKYFSALFLGLTLAFTSCEQNNVDPFANDEAGLVDFASVATSVTSTVNPGYIETITTPTPTATTSTSSKGKSCNVTGVDVSALPSAVTAYITANYAGATIDRAGTTKNGGTIVNIKLTDGSKLVAIFDASGNFVSAGTHEKHKGTEVAVENLPASVTQYITANYSGATIKKAVQNSEGKYVVVVKNADESVTGLAFDAAGVFTTEVALKGEFGGKHKPGPKHGPKGGKKKGKK